MGPSDDIKALDTVAARELSEEEKELLKTFNSGIGMILSVDANEADRLKALLEAEGETVSVLGAVTAGEGVRYSGALI